MAKREFEPPKHLSAKSKAVWRAIVPRRARSPERLLLVTTALEALDRADQARQTVEAAGLTVTTKRTGAVHLHPLVRVEREARTLFLRCWERLSLAFDFRVDNQEL